MTTDSTFGPWHLIYHWAEINGRYECVGLDIRSFREDKNGRARPVGDGLKAVTSHALRSIPIAELVRKAKQDGQLLAHEIATNPGFKASKAAKAAAKAAAANLVPQGRYDARHFLEVAKVYAEAWDRNQPPAKAVATTFGVSPTTAGKWVGRARTQHGFLEPTERRKANGNLTKKARVLLSKRGRPVRSGGSPAATDPSKHRPRCHETAAR